MTYPQYTQGYPPASPSPSTRAPNKYSAVFMAISATSSAQLVILPFGLGALFTARSQHAAGFDKGYLYSIAALAVIDVAALAWVRKRPSSAATAWLWACFTLTCGTVLLSGLLVFIDALLRSTGAQIAPSSPTVIGGQYFVLMLLVVFLLLAVRQSALSRPAELAPLAETDPRKRKRARIALVLLVPLLVVAVSLSGKVAWMRWSYDHRSAPRQPDSTVTDVSAPVGAGKTAPRLSFGDTAVYTDAALTVTIRVNSFQKAATNPPSLHNATLGCGLYWIANITKTYEPKAPGWRNAPMLDTRLYTIPEGTSLVGDGPTDVSDDVPDSFRNLNHRLLTEHIRGDDLTPFTVTGNAWYPNCIYSSEPRSAPPLGLVWYLGGLDPEDELAQWRL